jgi:hypothetical protein
MRARADVPAPACRSRGQPAASRTSALAGLTACARETPPSSTRDRHVLKSSACPIATVTAEGFDTVEVNSTF